MTPEERKKQILEKLQSAEDLIREEANEDKGRRKEAWLLDLSHEVMFIKHDVEENL